MTTLQNYKLDMKLDFYHAERLTIQLCVFGKMILDIFSLTRLWNSYRKPPYLIKR